MQIDLHKHRPPFLQIKTHEAKIIVVISVLVYSFFDTCLRTPPADKTTAAHKATKIPCGSTKPTTQTTQTTITTITTTPQKNDVRIMRLNIEQELCRGSGGSFSGELKRCGKEPVWLKVCCWSPLTAIDLELGNGDMLSPEVDATDVQSCCHC